MSQTEKILVGCTLAIVLTLIGCTALIRETIQRKGPIDPVTARDIDQLYGQLKAIEANGKASAKTLSDMYGTQLEDRVAASQRAWIERAGR